VDASLDVVEGSFDVAETKRAIAAAARRRVLMTDSTKFAIEGPVKVLPISGFDVVITDDELSPDLQAAIRDTGATLILA
jgi:DeoR/GlpR family transcriptional regulator of sugar metabolism